MRACRLDLGGCAARLAERQLFLSPLPLYSGGEGFGVRGPSPGAEGTLFRQRSSPPPPCPSPPSTGERGGFFLPLALDRARRQSPTGRNPSANSCAGRSRELRAPVARKDRG